MNNGLQLKKILAVIAVFLLTGCAGLLYARFVRNRCPETVITDIDGLSVCNLEKDSEGIYTATEASSWFELTGLDMYVKTIEVDADVLETSQHTIQIYYDDGTGEYKNSNTIKTAMRTGRTYLTFTGIPHVTSLRFNLLNRKNGKIRPVRIVLNPDLKANVPWVILAGIILAAATLFLTTAASLFETVIEALLACTLLAAGGYPAVLYGTGRIIPAFFILTGLLFVILSTVFLMKEGKAKRRTVTLILMIFSFLVCFVWAVKTPFAKVPDEGMHYDVVEFLTKYHFIPRGDDPRIRNENWGFSYTFSPILPFIIGSFFQEIVKLFSSSKTALLMAARMVSVLSAPAAVLFASGIGELLLPDSRAKYIPPVFLACYPEFLYLCTYVNSDAFALMTTSMIVYFWASGIRNSWRRRDGIGLAVGMGLCALSYYNCYGFILLSIPVFFLTMAFTEKSRGYAARMTALIVLVTFAVCGWWFIRNGILYDGDVLGRRALNEAQERYAIESLKPSNAVTPHSQGYSLRYMLFDMKWLKDTEDSFIAVFAVLSLIARRPVLRAYKYFLAVSGICAAAALLSRIIRRKKRDPFEKRKSILHVNLVFSILIAAFLAVYYSYMIDFQAQGRYAMPAIVPIAYFTALGAEWLGRSIGRIYGYTAGYIRTKRAVPAVSKGGLGQAGTLEQESVSGKKAESVSARIRLVTELLSMLFAAAMILSILLDTVLPYYMR